MTKTKLRMLPYVLWLNAKVSWATLFRSERRFSDLCREYDEAIRRFHGN